MGIVASAISQVIICAIWYYLGWSGHKDFGSSRENLRYYRMGLRNGLFFWAKVVMRKIRREKKEVKDE